MTFDWVRVRDLHGRALELHPDERGAFLDRECAGDEQLRGEIGALLAVHRDDQFLQPVSPDSAIPPRDLGDFELVREIGRGGMGVVYLAKQKTLSRDVAIKVLHGGGLADSARIDRFHREARAVARLRHEHIVTVLCDGVCEGAHWFAMDYVRGHDLSEELARQREPMPDAPPLLPPPQSPGHVATVARLVSDIADALQHAHAAGVVHRDVKPHNILLEEARRTVRLADFGLARDESAGSMTASGFIAGTPLYMSPEQARAVEARVDHRTDVYSLGVVLYEMLTLRHPFTGNSPDEIRVAFKTTDARLVRRINPAVPRDMETICHHAMAKDVALRYQTAKELGDDLRAFLAHEAIRARPPGVSARLRAWGRRNRRLLAGFWLLAAGCAAGLAWSAYDSYLAGFARLNVAAADASSFADATVTCASIDPATTQPGEWAPMKHLPLRASWTAPGYTRVRVQTAHGQIREYTRAATADQETTIDVSGNVAAIVDDMVLVRGGVLELPSSTTRLLPLEGQRVPLDDFLIDRTEVTNRDYRAFLASSGREPPSHWARVLPAHDLLPVSNVSWEDALAFAEWAGKRLPTFAEWTWAARGAENRIYPWAGGVQGELRGNVRREVVATWTADQLVDQYFACAEPVGSHPRASTPEGVHDLFGNVGEWTESVFTERAPNGLLVHALERFVAGHAWSDGTKGHSLATFGAKGVGRPYASASIGFRCARSVDNRHR